jgi:predicted nucleic acid-binding protein
MTELDAFLFQVLSCVEVTETPDVIIEDEKKIRDPKDRPILRAALEAHADLFLTGDKDFLEANVSNPKIMSVADFMVLDGKDFVVSLDVNR